MISEGGSVSTQYIADQLGVSQATLFKRFGSKSKLLQSAILLPSKTSKAKEMLDILQQGPTEEPVRIQLQRLCMRMLRFFDDVLPCFASLHAAGLRFEGALPENAPPILARQYLTTWVETLQQQGRIRTHAHPESIALTIIGAMQHRPLRIHLIRDNHMTQTDEEYVSSIVEVLWHGLSDSTKQTEPKEKP